MLFSTPTVAVVSPYIWLSGMTNMSRNKQQDPWSLGIYGALTCAAFLLPVVGALLFFFFSLQSSEHLHDRMVVSVLQAPVLFFDTNPVGRILNRFSNDIGCVDEILPKTFYGAVQYVLQLFSAVIIPILASAWMLTISTPLVLIFVYLTSYYLKTSRELKRLESTYRSPVFSHFPETIVGLDTIRTRGKEKDFIGQFY